MFVITNIRECKGLVEMPEECSTPGDESSIEAVIDSLQKFEKRSNRMILVGEPTWVRKIIHLLHVARITEVRDWSRLMPTRNSNEVISLMQRPRVEE